MGSISEETQNIIWDELVAGLSQDKDIPFIVRRENVGTIDGRHEAYYAVIASNFIIGRIDATLRSVLYYPNYPIYEHYSSPLETWDAFSR